MKKVNWLHVLLTLLLCAALVGGIEWALDKTPVSNVLLYGVMIAACAAMYACATRLDGGERRKEA